MGQKSSGGIQLSSALYDQMILLVLCMLINLWIPAGYFEIVGVLVTLLYISASLLVPSEPVKVVISVLCMFVSLLAFPLTVFFPVFAYGFCRQMSFPLGFLWAIPLAISLQFITMTAFAWLLVLSVVASFMAVRSLRTDAEAYAARNIRDSLAEQAIKLEHENKELSERSKDPLDSLDAKEADLVLSREFGDLTDRELAIVKLVSMGLENREIAHKLFLSEGTVRNHISTILQKKGLANRTQIAIMYYQAFIL